MRFVLPSSLCAAVFGIILAGGGCAGSKSITFMTYQPPDFDISLVKTAAVLGFEGPSPEVEHEFESLLIQDLTRHEYFTIVTPDRAAKGVRGNVLEAGRRLRVDAVITGTIQGQVEDHYTTQRNSKRVRVRYKTVTEYESRPVKETVTVRVKEKGKWVTRTRKVTVVKRVPVERRVPVYEHVPYTDKYLNRDGYVSVTLRLIETGTGNVLASRSATRRAHHRKLVSSNEPPDVRGAHHKGSTLGKFLSALVESAVEGSRIRRLNAAIPERSEMMHTLSTEVARELADQITPRRISVVRRLKSEGATKRGIAFAGNGQWDQAGREWRRARDARPEDPAVWNNLGVYYEHAGQYAEARDAYERAVALQSGERLYRRNLEGLASIINAMQKQTAALGAKIEETSLGLLVSSVLEGTLAERLGLRKGDIIVRVNHKEAASVDELEDEIGLTSRLGGALTVDLMRAGEPLSLNLALGAGRRRAAPMPLGLDPDPARSALEASLPAADVDQVVKSKIRRPDALGVILGIEDYRYAPSAPYARHDAMVAYEYFIRTLGLKTRNIYLRTDRDATQGEFRKVFDPDRGWLARRIKPGRTEVFVYYAGHGAPDVSTRDAYLIPADGDPNYLTTGYRLDELYRSLNRLSAERITVMLDACFSGRAGRGDHVETLLADARGIAVEARRVEVGSHVVVFTAAQGNQVSSSYPEKSHGLFTYFMLKGLQGHADKDGDNAVTVRELYAYIRDRVAERAGYLDREQTPELQGTDVDRVLVRY